MNMKSIARATLILSLVLAPTLALAQPGFVVGQQNTGGTFGVFFSPGTGGGFGGCSSTICGVGQNILYIINAILVPVLFAVAFIVFLYGIARAYIFSVGDPEKVKQGHTLILWGLIGFVVMISLWGLVNVVVNTFGLSGSRAPVLPVSYPF